MESIVKRSKGKEVIRSEMKKTLGALAGKKKKSAQICRRVISSALFRRARTVMLFSSFRSEVDTKRVIAEALRLKKRVVLPKVAAGKTRGILPVEIREPAKDLAPGAYGIMEPVSAGKALTPSAIDAVFIPGLAFDKRGYRIGYGGGYYDSFMRRIPRRKTAGLAFGAQVVKTMPRERHDVPVGRIYTEKGVIRC
jgi:5-formyltetrahydrofolate cyclo-ligase